MSSNSQFRFVTRSFKTVLSVLVALALTQYACTASHGPVDLTAVAPSDLTGIQLHQINGQGLDLSNRTLVNADLSVSRFPDATFAHSDLTDADLTRSIIDRVDFSGAILTGATLDFACGIETATWDGAVLDAKWATVIDVLAVNPTTNISHLDLSSVCFSARPYSLHDFSHSNLENAIFGQSGNDLEHADFTGANLRSVDFDAASLRGAVFVDADLTDAVIANSDLRDADFTNAILEGAWLTDSNIDGAIISPDQLRQAHINQ